MNALRYGRPDGTVNREIISIVIPVYNEEAQIARSVRTIKSPGW